MSDKKSGDTPHALQGQSAYIRLCEQIRAGVLKPGARLTETELAKQLGMSRTPVREAIRQLEADGLVDHQPRSGAVVRQLSYPEIMELYEMRMVLEGTAARLAARAASPMELEELQTINAEMARETNDPARRIHLNRQFHTRLLDAARNRFLLRSMEAVHKAILILGPSAMESPDRSREAVAEHDQVLTAMIARDDQGAEQAMRHHMERAQLTRLRMSREREPKDKA